MSMIDDYRLENKALRAQLLKATESARAEKSRADAYADRMKRVNELCTETLDGRIWKEFGRADAQSTIAAVREISGYVLPTTTHESE